MTDYGLHQVRDGRHVWRFSGRVLGSASSARMDAPRWSELAVYGLLNGSYIRSKVGFSTIAHQPACPLVDRHMIRWLDLDDAAESGRARVPCVVCQPVVGPGMDPLTMVESTRYTATVARDTEHLASLLIAGRPVDQLPRLVFRVVELCSAADEKFAGYWSSLTATARP